MFFYNEKFFIDEIKDENFDDDLDEKDKIFLDLDLEDYKEDDEEKTEYCYTYDGDEVNGEEEISYINNLEDKEDYEEPIDDIEGIEDYEDDSNEEEF